MRQRRDSQEVKEDPRTVTRATPPRVLIVEDASFTALHIKTILAREGYDVPAILSTGDEAIELATQLNLDLILMDIRLRGTIDERCRKGGPLYRSGTQGRCRIQSLRAPSQSRRPDGSKTHAATR